MSIYKSLALVSHALFVLVMCLHASADSDNRRHTCSPNPTKRIVVYIQDIQYTGTNTNYTDRSVAGIQGTEFGPEQFGTINVYDDAVTIAASPTSSSIGRFRGIYAVTALDGGVLYISATFQFTGGQYANSTLNIEGLGNSLINVPAQLAINGGTNTFNGAIGNVTLVSISETVTRAIINYRIAI